jgi:hypothetical protein
VVASEDYGDGMMGMGEGAGGGDGVDPDDAVADEVAYGDGSALLATPLERHLVRSFFGDVAVAGSAANHTADSLYKPLTPEEQDCVRQLRDCVDYVMPLPLALAEFKQSLVKLPRAVRTRGVDACLRFGTPGAGGSAVAAAAAGNNLLARGAEERLQERKREQRVLSKTATLFGYMDINEDNAVDRDELVHFFTLETGLARGQAVFAADHLLRQFDFNCDGTLSLDEIQKGILTLGDLAEKYVEDRLKLYRQTQLRRRAALLYSVRCEGGGGDGGGGGGGGGDKAKKKGSSKRSSGAKATAALLDDLLALLRAHDSNPRVGAFREQLDARGARGRTMRAEDFADGVLSVGAAADEWVEMQLLKAGVEEE